MSKQFPEPTDNDNIDCHLQQVGVGTLICRAARQSGEGTTNETVPSVCFNCPTGKVFRDVGCDAASSKIRLRAYYDDVSVEYGKLFCNIRKRETTYEYCQTCGLVTAEPTRQNITVARGLFHRGQFFAAYKDIEAARENIRDGKFDSAITRSIACLESVIRTIHDNRAAELPNKLQVTDLWKSARAVLKLEDTDAHNTVVALLGSLAGAVSHLGGMRNSLGDAHGKGILPPAVSESYAELALNCAAALSTFLIRRLLQMETEKNND